MKRVLLLLVGLWALPVTAQAQHRILALAPHACEMLYAIGAGDQIVGAVSYCDYPEAAKKLPRVGSYEGIHVEAALRLHPDLAVVMNRNVKGVAMLEKADVRIVESGPDSFADIFADLLALGEMTGRRLQAGALVASLQRRLQQVRRHVHPGTRVFYEIWYDPLITAGGPSFISDMIREAGGENVFAGVPMETPRVNVESVVRAAPELIVIPVEQRDPAARRRFWRRWLGNDIRFVVIDPDLMHRPGPRLLDGLELLQRALAGKRVEADAAAR